MLKIYKASAGSGKTFRLAYEYIKMVLGVHENSDDPDSRWILNPALLKEQRPSLAHRSVLAITFTNKSTEEMKNRIIKSLANLAKATKPSDHDYASDLIDEFGCTFDDLRAAANKAMVSLLLDFGFFNVSTIDSFFQTILRTFARQLDIQGDYNIEISSSDAISDALNMMLDQLNSIKDTTSDPVEKRVKKWLNSFVDRCFTDKDDKKGANIRFSPFQRNSGLYKGIIKDVHKIFTEHFKPLQADLRTYLEDSDKLTRYNEALARQIADFGADMARSTERLRTAIDEAGLSKLVNSNFDKALDKYAAGNVNSLASAPKSLANIADGNYSGGLFKKGAVISAGLSASLDSFRDDLLRLTAGRTTAKILKDQVPQLELIGLMLRYLDNVRKQNNMLILDDTSTHIWRIIHDSHVPFIYEHLGNTYRHFLIDEFQDTSRLQWRNILPLVQNSHSERDDSLIIGDVKQAIYRFRNSDSSILGYDLENKDFKSSDEREVHGDTPEENTNWRTAHGIVRFNNAFLPPFAALALDSQSPAGFCGDEVIQQCAARNAWMPSRLSFVPYAAKAQTGGGQGDTDGETVPYDTAIPLTKRPVAQGTEQKIKALVDEIRAQHDQRGFAWHDIAVLVRIKNNADPIIGELLKEGIPVQSAESLYLKNASSVRLILGVLTMLTHAGAPDAPIRARRPDEPHKTTGEAKIEQILFESRYNYFLNAGADSPQTAIDMALDPEEKKVDIELDSAVQGILDRHPSTLLATIEAIIARGLVPRATVMAEKDFIAAFCDTALRFSETFTNDAGAFLDWWRTHGNKLTVTPPADSDAVNIMTIHKSKGLEFKCVHLADFDWELLDDRETMWLDIRPTNDLGLKFDLPAVNPDLYPPAMLLELTESKAGYPGSPFIPILRAQQALMRADAMNVAYVALTRPVMELSVYYDPTSKPGTVAAVAASVLRDIVGKPSDNPLCLEIPADAYNPETGALFLATTGGEKKENSSHTSPAEAGVSRDMPDVDYDGEFYSSVRPDMSSFISVNSLERATDGDNDDDSDDAEPLCAGRDAMSEKMRRLDESTRRGIDLHGLLQNIIVPGDMDRAFEIMAGDEDFDADAADSYRETLGRAITPQIAERWFNPTDSIETEISYFVPCRNALDAFAEGEVKRIDRLVQRPDGSIDVVDYKFTTAETAKNRTQVREYVEAMRAIVPDANVRGFLWYVDLNHIVPVD